ncbi:hypothetical protein CDL12_21565 [Handroanthus impetiginosus]|uniref:Uncharacterized protein n=1 Tax=Handroanthus impetiginosus TaxID=429701 RepID=A0A2G9GKT1_9LAMI|nr:hypothetical protein CDL12_21565 [Handroanthus impetiginosus]
MGNLYFEFCAEVGRFSLTVMKISLSIFFLFFTFFYIYKYVIIFHFILSLYSCMYVSLF